MTTTISQEKNRMQLLRASDFCRRRQHADNTESSSSANSSTSTTSPLHHQSQSNKQLLVPIHLQVLSDQEFSQRLNSLSTTTTTTAIAGVQSKDIHNAALISSSNILRELSLVQGSLAVVQYHHHHHHHHHPTKRNNNSNDVLVQLLLVDTTNYNSSEQTTTIYNENNEDVDMDMEVTISATLAASLGCFPCNAWTKVNEGSEKIGTTAATTLPGFLKALDDRFSNDNNNYSLGPSSQGPSPDAAQAVVLKCLGRPLHRAAIAVWPRPRDGILFQRGSILHAQDSNSQQSFYYQVIDIVPSTQQQNSNSTASTSTTASNTNRKYFRTTNKTDFQFLDHTSNSSDHHEDNVYCRRIPHQPQTTLCPHPDVPSLLQALLGISPQSSSPAERVYPIIGTDQDHDVRRLVQTVASGLGMRCLAVPGLAAFAAANGHPVTTGSLMDRLEGLQMALDQAKQSRPCILHLVDLDQEFTSHRQDPTVRDEQEHRFWSVLMDALDTTRYYRRSSQDNHHQADTSTNTDTVNSDTDGTTQRLLAPATTVGSSTSAISTDDINHDIRYTPSLIVVISTTQPLSKTSPSGPLIQNLIYNPIHLSHPDAAYASFLWKEYDREEPFYDRDDQDNKVKLDDPETNIQDLLAGRAVFDIRTLHKQWYNNANSTDGGAQQQQRERLAELCQQLDRERRTQSSKSASLVKIANVKWEDVGGLTQVRKEIMDTVELPLMYPHFFPNGGRSGILLYGPPGTGKTLVAKAVATECNIPFLSVKGPELLGSYVGESEANVRAVFSNAREAAMAAGSGSSGNAPSQSTDALKNKSTSSSSKPTACLVFFDELDSLAPRRDDTASGSGGGVMDRVVATLAAELDKGQEQPTRTKGNLSDGNCYIFVLGATNRPDLLDPSLLRPGRFDRMVYLGVASTPEDRTRILAAQIRNLKFEQDQAPEDIAKAVVHDLPDNLTGADLSSIGSGALSRATQRLCNEADKEVQRRLEQEARLGNTPFGNNDEEEYAMLDKVLSEWDDSHLVPVVTIDDLLEASKEVIPSVSHAELQRYERLRVQFSSS